MYHSKKIKMSIMKIVIIAVVVLFFVALAILLWVTGKKTMKAVAEFLKQVIRFGK